jgi:hypothetical protein
MLRVTSALFFFFHFSFIIHMCIQGLVHLLLLSYQSISNATFFSPNANGNYVMNIADQLDVLRNVKPTMS